MYGGCEKLVIHDELFMVRGFTVECW